MRDNFNPKKERLKSRRNLNYSKRDLLNHIVKNAPETFKPQTKRSIHKPGKVAVDHRLIVPCPMECHFINPIGEEIAMAKENPSHISHAGQSIPPDLPLGR